MPTFGVCDVLRLKNGNEFRGRVSENPDGSYEVFVEPGHVFRVARREVLERIPGEAPYDEFQRRFRALRDSDRQGWIELATWAERMRLRQSALRAFRRVLQVDPHHAGARDRLGFVLFRNRWVPRSELEEQGLVRFRGLWMQPRDVEDTRRKEAEQEFRALLADVHADNRYLRENALLTLSKEDNPRLLPLLGELTSSDEPLERVVAARILGNFSYEQSGDVIYGAILSERRDEVVLALVAALRGQKQALVGDRVGAALATHQQLQPAQVQNLLVLAENCPTKSVIPGVLALLDEERWARLADRTLTRILGAPSRDVSAWRRYWRENRSAFPTDLGSGWLR
ncbi:MAG: hypothetical protein AAF581_21545 [Planctomycetota bacterium]